MTIATGMQTHWRRLKAQAGIAATWKRGLLTWAVDLVPMENRMESTLESGASIESKDQGFDAHYKEFFDIVGDAPADGDKIEYTDANGDVRIYEVISPLGSKPWSWIDTAHVMIRINCQEVED